MTTDTIPPLGWAVLTGVGFGVWFMVFEIARVQMTKRACGLYLISSAGIALTLFVAAMLLARAPFDCIAGTDSQCLPGSPLQIALMTSTIVFMLILLSSFAVDWKKSPAPQAVKIDDLPRDNRRG